MVACADINKNLRQAQLSLSCKQHSHSKDSKAWKALATPSHRHQTGEKNQLLLVIAITALHFAKWICSLWNAYLLLGVDAASGGEGGEKKLVPFFCLFSSCINLSSLCCCSNFCSSSLDRRCAKDAAKKLLPVPNRKQNHTNLDSYI